MQQVEDWINGERNFNKGVDLYLSLGTDNALKSLLKLGKNSFTEKKLLDGMTALSPPEPEPEPVKKQLPDKVRGWLKEREIYHNNLFYTPSLSDRKKLCFAILAIGKKLDRYFDDQVIDEELPPPSPTDDLPVNAWDMHVAFGNNRSYITKNKKVAEKAGEVKRRESQNKIIEERMKSLNYGVV